MNIIKLSPKERYYCYDKIIGKGAFKKVYQAYDVKKGIYVAWNSVNLVHLNVSEKKSIQKELSNLIKIRNKHDNILNIHSSWYEEDKGELILITDLYLAGSLKTFINNCPKLNIGVLKNWCKQILSGLNFLHSNGIIHRDIKCDNILINGINGNIVIGDFGVSGNISDNEWASTMVGTPEFMAPEMFDGKYNYLSDIYSFGMMLLELITRKYPYNECNNVAQIWKNISNQKKPKLLEEVKNIKLKNLIIKCLSYEFNDRPEIIDLLNDDFFVIEENNDDYIIYDTSEKSDKEIENEIVKTLNQVIELDENESDTIENTQKKT